MDIIFYYVLVGLIFVFLLIASVALFLILKPEMKSIMLSSARFTLLVLTLALIGYLLDNIAIRR